MSQPRWGSQRLWRPVTSLLVGVALAVVGVTGAAFASGSSTKPVAKATTPAWSDGKTVTVQYAQNFFCDTSVASQSPSGCEVGTDSNLGPVPNADRSVLYVLVPLFAGATPAPMCAVASCPNHPLDIDLSRIAGALGASPDAVRSVPLPAHSHILDGDAGGWWDVKVVAVTNQNAWSQLAAGKSEATMNALIADPSSGVLGPIPTNLYLFFNVVGH